MKNERAIKLLCHWDTKGRFVYTLDDLAKLFPEDGPRTLQEGVNRLVKAEILQRVGRGIYLYNYARSKDAHVIEHIAKAMRRGEYNYVSLESALSEFGAISQIPVDRLTVMTTGRKGEYRTPYGTIEFTHTSRNLGELLDSFKEVGRPLRMAKLKAAWRDLKRVGRNVQLVDEDTLAYE
jgi:predicted transcriptional regulator of viral defense system